MRMFPGGLPPTDLFQMSDATEKIDFRQLHGDERAVTKIKYADLYAAVGRYYEAHRTEFPFQVN
jgi:hypothetical protein